MSLQQYLSESEKQYHMRLKTVMPVDDAIMDQIEVSLAKYLPLSISRPMKTILQRAPLDFPNVLAAEVYIVDMTFGLPAAPHVVRSDIRKLLNAPDAYVVVRNFNEPGEIEELTMNAISDIEAEAERRGLSRAAMLDDPDYSEKFEFINNDELAGDGYNEALVAYLSTVEDERKEVVAKSENAPFKWLDLPDRTSGEPVQDDANFNAHIKGAPYTSAAKARPNRWAESQSIHGNIDPSETSIRRVYVDRNGKKIVLTRKLAGEQK